MGRGVNSKIKSSLNIATSPEWDWIQSGCGNNPVTCKLESYLKCSKKIRLWEHLGIYEIKGHILYAKIESDRKPPYSINVPLNSEMLSSLI